MAILDFSRLIRFLRHQRPRERTGTEAEKKKSFLRKGVVVDWKEIVVSWKK